MTTHPHPEWRRLKQEISPLLQVGRVFSYSELSALAGIDVQTNKGRKHLLKACAAILAERSMALENVRGVGMQVIAAPDHAPASQRRVLRSKRQMKKAHDLLRHCDYSQLTQDQQRHHSLMEAAIGGLLHQVSHLNRNVKKIAERIRANELPDDRQIKALEEMNRTWSKN